MCTVVSICVPIRRDGAQPLWRTRSGLTQRLIMRRLRNATEKGLGSLEMWFPTGIERVSDRKAMDRFSLLLEVGTKLFTDQMI